MLTNQSAKRIIFYGDSLVWGKVPGANEQYLSNVRFTGVLQQVLGDEYDIVEAGLRARNLYGENPYFPDRDGLKMFSPIIGSLMPADAVVLFLGSNDTNNKPGFDAAKIAQSLETYKTIMQEWATFLQCSMPKIAVVLPPLIDAASFDPVMQKIFAGAEAKIEPLRQALNAKAKVLNLPVFDASIVSPDSADGIHLSRESNRQLGEALAPFIENTI